MAKFEEGDARWIVNDLGAAGRNVGQWHWTEKDCTAWAKQRLGQLFDGLVLVDGPKGKVTATGTKAVEGDATLNVRKGRLVPVYELDIKLGWEGQLTGEEGSGSGTIHVPYLAEENHGEDADFKVACDKEDKPCLALKDLIRSQGKQALQSALATFVADLTAGGPLQQEQQGQQQQQQQGQQQQQQASSSQAPDASTSGNGAASAAAAPKAAPKPKASTKGRLELTQTFYCRPQDLFECFTAEGKLRAFTQSPATLNPVPGGDFSWMGGAISGKFEEVQPPNRLVLSWRFNTWEDGVFSKVVMDLEEPERGNTVLKLTHTDIPYADKFGNSDVVDVVEKGWQGQILQRIRSVFGYGL